MITIRDEFILTIDGDDLRLTETEARLIYEKLKERFEQLMSPSVPSFPVIPTEPWSHPIKITYGTSTGKSPDYLELLKNGSTTATARFDDA